MSKVICDICGTTYQDTADCCPICGCAREIASRLAKEEFVVDSSSARPVSKKREIFDFDEANNTPTRPSRGKNAPERPYQEDDTPEEPEPQHNTFLVIVLTVLIVALLAVTGFLFVKFLMPNLGGHEETIPTTEPEVTEFTQPATTELRIPCQSLALSTGNAELTHAGNAFLLNVIVTPEDTTDELTFVSEDESIATVTTDGRITAVSEGETVIRIICGDQWISCPVVCSFHEDDPSGADNADAPQATTEVVVDPSVELKLKKDDIRLGVYYQFQLELDCELEPTQVTWTSAHPHIATVDDSGVVTAIQAGTTEITAKYGTQEVTCIVRCF